MEKLYDLSEFEALAMGDEAFIKELLAANVESIEEGITDINSLMAAGNLDAVGQAAHKIKPLLAMLKAGEIHQAIVDLEYYSRKEFNPDRAQAAFAIFQPNAPILLQQLKALL
jgi:hypothetical protein